MKTLNVGIFAHIDAGKTTLSERLLFEAGALRTPGSVDGGTCLTDFLPVERRRGVSVRDATVTFVCRDVEINLIDTPGHADFFEETELAFSAVDVAVLVVSAREGAQAILRRRLPLVIFVNKCDMEGVSPKKIAPILQKLLHRELFDVEEDEEISAENAVSALGDEELLEGYLAGSLPRETLRQKVTSACSSARISPVLYGSARTGDGVPRLIGTLCSLFEFPRDEAAPFSAFVYQVEHRKNVGKIAHMRIFCGKLGVRGEVFNRRTGSSFKAVQLKQIRGERYADVPVLAAGEVGAAAGLADVRAGDFLGDTPPVEDLRVFTPYLRIKVDPCDKNRLTELKEALEQLSDESPSLALEWVPEKRELTVSCSGKIRTEILKETLLERFGIEAEIGAPSVIYRETPARAAHGFEAYTMPKPCWAVVHFLIEPLPRGSGFRYESVASEKRIAYRYQEHVKTEVPRVLQQGLMGWQVVDLKVTLLDGEHHVQHTHPLDFFTATPMGIMDGLRNAGTVLLEPVLRVRICAPGETLGKVTAEISARRAVFGPPVFEGEKFLLTADIPAGETFDLQERIASLTGGRGSCDSRLLGFLPCPEGHGAVRERIGVNPLDRSLWILHCRGAYRS